MGGNASIGGEVVLLDFGFSLPSAIAFWLEGQISFLDFYACFLLESVFCLFFPRKVDFFFILS